MSKNKRRFFTVQDMVLIAVFTALIAICSWITVPAAAGQIPFTLQTFAVFVTAGLLGAKRASVSVVIYILLGMAGIPVFSGFTGGLGVIIGPTGGYIIGFIFTTIIIGVGMQTAKKKRKAIRIAISSASMILGDAVCFLVGTIWFMVLTNTNITGALTLCVIPFIIPDIIKIIAASIVVDRLKKYV